MPAANVQRELIVFPTELALRRYQQEQALEHGWVDASCHTTFSRLHRHCLLYAGLKGQRMNAVRHLLMRRQVVEVASGHFAGKGTLGDLSNGALSDVLEQLVNELAALPTENTRIIDWMLDHHRQHKLYQLGTLISIWRASIKQEGLIDQIDLNLAILKLLKGGRQNWPPLLRDCRRLTFRSVRWFNPFEESCVAALNHKLAVRVESALPAAHAEMAEDRLGQCIRSEIMSEPWAFWAEDLSDALAVDSPDVLQLTEVSRIHFSRSAGPYGEIEDLARRMCWHLETTRLPAHQIALIVPDMGAVQDIIPHVFSRFRIPYFFRRGRPVLSSPCVKTFFAWLAFPLHPERDALIDLIRNPALRFDRREEAVEVLLKKKTPPRVDPNALPWFRGWSTCSGRQAAERLEQWMVQPEDHFNSEALKTVSAVLDEFDERPLPLGELVDLLEVLLENSTVKPRDSHEQGVWILKPDDAIGLNFDLVFFAGLNEGAFPSVPQQDALLSDKERYRLKMQLEEQGRHLPRMALPEGAVKFGQEAVMFLTALGMAREQLVFSCQSVDQEGNEKGEGEYYRKLWNLAGWGAQNEIELNPYDQWRTQALPPDHVFLRHWNEQQGADPENRKPMPGESFLPLVPLPLCRARDEALQTAVADGATASGEGCDRDYEREPVGLTSIDHLVAMLEIEAERDAFLETPPDARTPSKYCGYVERLKEKVAEWFVQQHEISPTALESLAQCRYVFLLERIFGLDETRVADDTPDPMDRGILIHAILKTIYTAIAEGSAGIDAPRYWAVKTERGWEKRNEDGVDAIPLATFIPELRSRYEAFAERVTVKHLKQAELGHPDVWAAEREKVLEQILNFIRHDAETCAAENRFPARFELPFNGDSAVDLGGVRLKGRIDRVDLLFADTGTLKKIHVFDYKGSSRARNKKEDYIEEIRRNLDCQLPIYAFAAQQYFFGVHNTAEVNALTATGYLFYQREMNKIRSELKKCLIPMDEEGVLDTFLSTLFENIRRLKGGDFAIDPLIKSYNDYQSVCRTDAVTLEDLVM